MPDGKKLPAGFIPDGFVPDAPATTASPAAPAQPADADVSMNMARAMSGQPMATPGAQQQFDAGKMAGTKAASATIGGMVAPELIPEVGGGGIMSFLGRVLGRGALSGVGTAVGNAVASDKPLSSENLSESAKLGLFTAAISTPLEFIGGLAKTKFGRSAINQSLGAQARDVTYGNPARFLTDNNITDISTGDYEAYKDALRAGQKPEEAAASAGGRFAAVSQRVNEYGQRLDRLLANKPASIPVQNVIVKPLDTAMNGIIDNPALDWDQKIAAHQALDGLRKSMLDTIGPNPAITPADAQKIKQAIGNQINWLGKENVSNYVLDGYKNLYAELKTAINKAVPEAQQVNEQLSNGLAAFSDLDNLARAEEVGRGSGITRGKMGIDLMGMIEGELGRALPAAKATVSGPNAVPTGASILQQLLAKGRMQPQQNQSPGLPFSPGAGIPKP